MSASTRGIGEGVSNQGYLDDFGFGKYLDFLFNLFIGSLYVENFNQYEAPEVPKSYGTGVSKMEMQGKVEEKRKK